MAKSNRKLVGGAIIIILILVAFGYVTNLKLDFTSSSNVLSIQQTQLIKNPGDGLPAEKIWRALIAIGTGGGESLYGSTSIQQNLQDGTQKSQESLLIKTKDFSSSCNYPLTLESATTTPSYKKIVNLPMRIASTNPLTGAIDLKCLAAIKAFNPFGPNSYETTVPSAIPSDCVENAKSYCSRNGGVLVADSVDNPVDIFGVKLSYRTNVYQCIQLATDTSKPLYFYSSTNPQILTSVTMQISKGSSNKEFTLTNSNPSYRDNDIYAYKLPGGLLDYNGGCPSSASFEFVKTTNSNTILGSGQYTTIPINSYIGIGTISLTTASSRAIADQLVSQYNGKIVNAISGSLYSSGLPSISNDGKSGAFVISSSSVSRLNSNSTVLPSAPTFPLITLDVSADWLQVLRQEATPKIQSLPQSCSFRSNGETKSISIDVKDTGSSEGTIRTSISCNGISVSPNTPIAQNYQPGSTLSNQFSLTSTNEGSFTCNVLAVNAGDTQRDQATFTCLVNKQCDKVPTGNYILDPASCTLICNPNLASSCTNSTIFDGTTCSCIPKSGNSGSCKPDNPQPSNAHWDINICKYQCDSGYISTLDQGCKLYTPPQDQKGFLEMYGLYIAIVIVIVGVGYWAFKPQGGRKR